MNHQLNKVLNHQVHQFKEDIPRTEFENLEITSATLVTEVNLERILVA